MKLSAIDQRIVAAYLAVIMGIGFAVKRQAIVQIRQQRYPNLQIVYLSSRTLSVCPVFFAIDIPLPPQ
jgi:hypothetical protein